MYTCSVLCVRCNAQCAATTLLWHGSAPCRPGPGSSSLLLGGRSGLTDTLPAACLLLLANTPPGLDSQISQKPTLDSASTTRTHDPWAHPLT